MTRAELLAFLRARRHAVVATTGPNGEPQAAVVGIAVSDTFEIVFDTVEASRKLPNLRARPRVAFVVGGFEDDAQRTVQLEGDADVPTGAELERVRAIYFARFPDGPSRLGWPGITHVRVRPTWLRTSDFRGAAPLIVEFDAAALRALT
ncbi:MAG TPA: pyridoxamine 5'-phosphate oxidase family protein [Polyangia bacterium]|nr:pyridoxamine 5'-phosphate oxidase family protein [Polyangia bacterium]